MKLCVPLTAVCACVEDVQEALLASSYGSSRALQQRGATSLIVLNILEHRDGLCRLQGDIVPLANIVAL